MPPLPGLCSGGGAAGPALAPWSQIGCHIDKGVVRQAILKQVGSAGTHGAGEGWMVADHATAGRSTLQRRLIGHLLSRPVVYAIGLIGLTALAVALILANFGIEGDIAKTLKGRLAAPTPSFSASKSASARRRKTRCFMVQAVDFGAEDALVARSRTS